jgi:hypothetical protein
MSPIRPFLSILLLSMVAVAPAARAQSCDATFSKKGNPVTGLRFSAATSIAELGTSDAINQLRGISLARGYDVLATEAEAGDLLIEMPQAMNRRSFPLIAKASTDGGMTTVQLRANLKGGVFANADSVRVELCGLLGAIKGGQAGVLAAEAGKTATGGNGAPTEMNAQMLADRVSKERDQNVNEIPLRYKDRSFIIEGVVEKVLRDGDRYTVIFEIIPWERKVVRAPGESQQKTDIFCLLASGQSVYALTLKPRTKVRLKGTFLDYRANTLPSVMLLSECKPAP